MIDPTSIVDKKAKIGKNVHIGPFCVVGPEVTLHDNCFLHSHVNVQGKTTLFDGVEVFSFASVGAVPQDLKYTKGEEAFLEVGKKSVIRECVTLNLGSPDQGPITKVGENTLLMAYSHLGHNAQVGSHAVLANAATIAGHVLIEDYAVIGGLVGVHQFTRIGKMAIVGGCSKVVKDIPPFMLADGNPAKIRSINKVGLQRHGIETQAISALKDVFKIIYRKGHNMSNALLQLDKDILGMKEVKEVLTFIENSERGVAKGGKS